MAFYSFGNLGAASSLWVDRAFKSMLQNHANLVLACLSHWEHQRQAAKESPAKTQEEGKSCDHSALSYLSEHSFTGNHQNVDQPRSGYESAHHVFAEGLRQGGAAKDSKQTNSEWQLAGCQELSSRFDGGG